VAKFRVEYKTWASKTVLVEIPDADLQAYIDEAAEDQGVPVDQITIEDYIEKIEDAASEQDQQYLCHQCAGGRDRRFFMDLGDWEVDDDPAREPKYRGVRRVDDNWQ
jgi:hypothetical protein